MNCKSKKMKNTYFKAIAFLLLTGLFGGCSEDFLERPPKSNIVDANFYQTTDQVLAGTAPLYNQVWFSYNDKASHGIGDARGGILSSNSYQLTNIQMNTTAVTGENSDSWRSFFNVIAQSNTVISNINQFAGESVPESIKQHGIAEARFMRGMAYSFLVQNWGPVPIIEDNTTLLQDTTKTRNTVESVWEFIIRDFQFATENLPEEPVLPGRLTSFSAKGMLAKMHLIRSGVASAGGNRDQADLDMARTLAKDVIDNSGARLLEDYEDLFLTINNNNAESLFALQWSYNGTWGSQNSVQAFLAFGSSITGFSDGWGGDIGGSYYILEKYEDLIATGSTPDVRRKATYMFPGDHYDYISQEVDGVVEDLRVPVGNEGFNERAWVKKYVVGRPEDNDGRVLQQRTEINTYMLRLADVYLIYAESILGNSASTADAEALEYFNRVRERAGVSTKTSLTFEDIFNERLVEFAMEGQAWYEFTRLHYYNPQMAYDILSQQERGIVEITPDQEIDPTAWTIVVDESRQFPVDLGNFIIPIPATELTRAPNLRKPPVPYEFQ